VTATCTSGLDGTVSSNPTDETAPLNLKLTTPKSVGGSGDSGHNPDQLLAAGYSGKLNQRYHYTNINIGMNNNNIQYTSKIQRAFCLKSKKLRPSWAREKSARGLLYMSMSV
jgi:organic hydroperoxide reductase OsmC/OhrA